MSPYEHAARVQQLKEEVRAAWRDACTYDGIDPNASIVVFSDDNPHVERRRAAMARYLDACRRLEQGGAQPMRHIREKLAEKVVDGVDLTAKKLDSPATRARSPMGSTGANGTR